MILGAIYALLFILKLMIINIQKVSFYFIGRSYYSHSEFTILPIIYKSMIINIQRVSFYIVDKSADSEAKAKSFGIIGDLWI